jgi:protein-arginine kinase activator protein McsA
MSDIKKVLMTLLENDIIGETHHILEREHINTLEDVVDELLIEYNKLANEVETKNESVRVCEKCKKEYTQRLFKPMTICEDCYSKLG